MNKVNIALLSALYNGKSNLYKEIYFPIVEFALTCCLKEAKDKCTSSIEKLHVKINQEFGVLIPRAVIKKAISHMATSNRVRANLLDNDILQVHKVDMSVLEDIYNKGELVDLSLQRLERSYIDYFQERGIIPEKTFVEFFSAKTQEIEDYLGSKVSDNSMGEEYTHNVQYISWLEKNNLDLYESANKILWGAIVAGFLGRDNYEFGVKPVSECKYYLDTPIIMGCLDLSYEQATKYSQELIQIIKASGAIACVHSITLDEITSILKGVECEGSPRYGSSIYEAFERRGLTCTELASIRINLEKIIQELGVLVLSNKEEVLKIKKEYAGKSIVKKLEAQRSEREGGENPREIHDVYMIDLVRKENGNIVMKEKVKAYFVTNNVDLRKFSFEHYNSPVKFSIAPSSVIFDLWLHGASLQSKTSSLSLTETMSRCLALNEQTATLKIRKILKCLESTEMNDPKVIQEIFNGVMERSHKYISSDLEVESNDNITPDTVSQMYKQAKQDLNAKEEIAFKMKGLQDENIRISQEKEDLEAEVTKLREQEKRRKDLEEERQRLQDTLDELTPKRRCATRWFYFWYTIEAISNIVLLSLFIFAPSQIAPTISIWKPEWKTILEEANLCHCIVLWIILTGSLYIAIGKRSRIFNCKKYKRTWDNEHPKYGEAVDRVKEIKQELEGL